MAELERIISKDIRFVVVLSKAEVDLITDALGNHNDGYTLYAFFDDKLKMGKK